MHKRFPEKPLALLRTHTELEPLEAGAFAYFRAGAMRVKIQRYAAAGIGHVCLLQGSAMLGLMRMYMMVVNPSGRDMPLYSWDYITAMGKHTLILELYNTCGGWNEAPLLAVQQTVSGIPAHGLGTHWYDSLKAPASTAKKVRAKEAGPLATASAAFLDAYLTTALDAPPPGKQGATTVAQYVDGLLENGGPSTDAFVKALGPEKTAQLFREVVFGCGSGV